MSVTEIIGRSRITTEMLGRSRITTEIIGRSRSKDSLIKSQQSVKTDVGEDKEGGHVADLKHDTL